MSVRITCINKANGYHENPYTAIEQFGWVNENNNQTGKSTRLEMYDFVSGGGSAYVKDWKGNTAYLIAETTANGTKYVKTKPDGTKTDNLLSLDECK